MLQRRKTERIEPQSRSWTKLARAPRRGRVSTFVVEHGEIHHVSGSPGVCEELPAEKKLSHERAPLWAAHSYSNGRGRTLAIHLTYMQGERQSWPGPRPWPGEVVTGSQLIPVWGLCATTSYDLARQGHRSEARLLHVSSLCRSADSGRSRADRLKASRHDTQNRRRSAHRLTRGWISARARRVRAGRVRALA